VPSHKWAPASREALRGPFLCLVPRANLERRYPPTLVPEGAAAASLDELVMAIAYRSHQGRFEGRGEARLASVAIGEGGEGASLEPAIGR
jgi:hypothetical protein